MRIFFLIVCLLCFIAIIATSVFATTGVYVIYKTDTKDVLSVSNQDDAVVPDGYSKEILPGDLNTYPLEYNVQDYRFNGKKFVANTKKINDREAAIVAYGEREAEVQAIKKRAYKTAYDAMVAEGVKFKYIDGTKF